MKYINSVCSFVFLLSFIGSAIAVEPIKYRVLLSVSEDSVEKMQLAINSAYNLQKEFGRQNVEVNIVTFGPGVRNLIYYSPLGEFISHAVTRGVRIVACENSMKQAKLRSVDMNKSIHYVASGVVDITIKQAEGWQYIRP
jgi:intracellular sulfur oxidation DsrE/DsrF family protein